MAASATQGRAIAAMWAAIAISGCLDTNPKFVEPPPLTAGASEGATTTSGATMAETPTSSSVTATTTGYTTEASNSITDDTMASVTTDMVTSGMSTYPVTGTTGMGPECGDEVVEAPEQCDAGIGNADDGDCTTQCAFAVCGDGLKHASLEDCDDVNNDIADGCIDCKVPRSCYEIKGLVPNAVSGQFLIDTDGLGPNPAFPVFCDMATAGGGWTLYERSPLADPIGVALYKDMPVSPDQPMMSRYRMPKSSVGGLMQLSAEAWIGCEGNDHLLFSAMDLFKGEFGPQDCSNAGEVLYLEAELKGYKKMNIPLCTQFVGVNDGECPGAWSIDEYMQQNCQLPNLPWNGDIITSDGADTFAVDTYVLDSFGQIHDCHQPGATRVVMLR